MKIGHITQPNAKGQIVIPKEIREKTGIKPGTPVEITLEGNTVILRRIVGIITPEEDARNKHIYMEFLKKTRGVWADNPEEIDTQKKRRSLELKASRRRRQSF